MRLAVETSVPASRRPGRTSQLGKLFISGDYAAAERSYRIALAYVPGIRLRARRTGSGRGRSRAADGRAIALERRAVGACPCPSTSPSSATCTWPLASGAAREQYASSARSRVLGANGVKTDLEMALFQRRPRHPLAGGARARARIAYRAQAVGRRQPTSSRGRSTRTGRCAEAKRYSRLALRLGHAGRAEVLPSRDDRALPRQRRRSDAWLQTRARPESQASRCCGRR